VSDDARARRIAVVADSLLEPAIDELGPQGYGIIQLPPAALDARTAAAWLEQTAEHVAEFRRHDYEIVLVDDGMHTAALVEALARLDVPPLPPHAVRSST
jgi:hypothetical protein